MLYQNIGFSANKNAIYKYGCNIPDYYINYVEIIDSWLQTLPLSFMTSVVMLAVLSEKHKTWKTSTQGLYAIYLYIKKKNYPSWVLKTCSPKNLILLLKTTKTLAFFNFRRFMVLKSFGRFKCFKWKKQNKKHKTLPFGVY